MWSTAPTYSPIGVLVVSLSLILVRQRVVRSFEIGTTPDISIGGWMESDLDSREWHTNSSPPLGNSPYPDAIVVPNSVRGLSLVCNASYPVEWRFHRERWGGRGRLQYALQTTVVSNLQFPISQDTRFSSELSFFSFESNSVSGNYTCQKVGYPGLSQSLYVFWEGASPPYLTLARSYRKPPQIPFRKNESASFTLPCTVSVPTVEPQLTKEVDSKEEEIKRNASIQYDPRVGFILSNLPNPYGRYTCHGGDAEDGADGDGDVITFNVIDADDGPKSEFNETIKHGAFYNINATSRELTCCSAGQKPPKLKLVECDHPTICALAKHSLHTMESAKKKELSCSIIPLHILRAGVFRCVGAGIDVVREYFYPMPETPQPWHQKGKGKWGGKKPGSKGNATTEAPPPTPVSTISDDPYFDWNEAESTKMMMVTKLQGPVYVGENRTFSCRVSHFYYAQGLVWSLTFLNDSEVFLNGRDAESNDHFFHGGKIRHFDILVGKNQQLLDLTITADLKNITCYAPVWNATQWDKKMIKFVVKVPTAPQLKGKPHKEYSWYLNDTKKSLECQFSGEPMPKVLWKKGNTTFAFNTLTENGTSRVNFPRVALDSDGTYECILTNEAGRISKTFRVTVLHSTSSTISAILILSLVGFVVVSIVAGFMFKYLKSQNNVINHLANLAFKDVATNSGDNTNASSTQHTTNNPATNSRHPISVDATGMILPPLSFSAPTASSAQPNSLKSPGNISNGSSGGRTNNGFVFGYPGNNRPSSEEDPHQDDPHAPQPPLSSFSSYHKF